MARRLVRPPSTFQQKGQNVIDLVQLAVAPGEHIMCATGIDQVASRLEGGPERGRDRRGSSTDDLVNYVSTRAGLGPRTTARSPPARMNDDCCAQSSKKAVCSITSPTDWPDAVEELVGYSAVICRPALKIAKVARQRLSGGTSDASSSRMAQSLRRGGPGASSTRWSAALKSG